MIQDNQNFSKEGISIKELFFVIRSQIKKLFLIMFLFLLFSIVYLIITRPIYTSSGSIIIEEENSTMSSIFDMGLGSDMNYLENEIEVLKSRTTSEKAVQSLEEKGIKNAEEWVSPDLPQKTVKNEVLENLTDYKIDTKDFDSYTEQFPY